MTLGMRDLEDGSATVLHLICFSSKRSVLKMKVLAAKQPHVYRAFINQMPGRSGMDQKVYFVETNKQCLLASVLMG